MQPGGPSPWNEIPAPPFAEATRQPGNKGKKSKAPKAPKRGKKSSPVLLVVLIILILGAGGFAAYKFLLSPSTTQPDIRAAQPTFTGVVTPSGILPTLEPTRTPAPTSTPIQNVAFDGYGVIKVNSRIWDYHSTAANVMEIVSAPKAVKLTGHTPDKGWYQIENSGWVEAANLNLTSKEAALTAAVPPPTPTFSAAKGTGLKRADMQALFEKNYNFKFDSVTLVNGQPRSLGKSSNGISFVDLYGPDSNLTEITFSFQINTPDPNIDFNQNLVYMAFLLRNAVPGLNDPGNWLVRGFYTAQGNNIASATIDNLKIELIWNRPLVKLSITPK